MSTIFSNISLTMTPMMYTMGIYLVAFFIFGGIIFWVGWKIREKNIYKWPVTISTRVGENGIRDESNDFHGGIKKNKIGERDFHIKHKRFFWKKIFLGEMPDFSKADVNNRLYFIKEGDGTDLQQYDKTLVTRKIITDGNETKEVKLLATPVPTSHKIRAKNHLMMTDNLLDTKKLTAWTITIIAFIIMAVVQIAFLYFTRKR